MNKLTIFAMFTFAIAVLNSCEKSGSSESIASSPSNTGTGGSMAKYTIMNNYMYTIQNNNLKIYNVANASTPVMIKEMKLQQSWSIETIFANEDYLFFGTTSGMLIYNLVNPELPVYVSSYQHVVSCDPVVVDNKFAYVTLSSEARCPRAVNALEIIDISDIAKPVMVKSYNFPSPKGMAISGNYLYLCDGKSGLRVIDISNSPQVTVVNTIDSLKSTYDAIVKNNMLTVTGTYDVSQYDCSDPLNLVFISKIKTTK